MPKPFPTMPATVDDPITTRQFIALLKRRDREVAHSRMIWLAASLISSFVGSLLAVGVVRGSGSDQLPMAILAAIVGSWNIFCMFRIVGARWR